MGLARSARVKNKNRGRLDGQDQAGHLNPTVQTTCGLRWPESQGFWRLYFDEFVRRSGLEGLRTFIEPSIVGAEPALGKDEFGNKNR
jgi:hypothetical protein